MSELGSKWERKLSGGGCIWELEGEHVKPKLPHRASGMENQCCPSTMKYHNDYTRLGPG